MKKIFVAVMIFLLPNCKKENIPLPVSPANLKATAVSNSQISLSWTDKSTNELGFRIERRTTGTSYVEIASLNSDVSSYLDLNLVKNTEYTYRVYAYNSGGKSITYTNEATATTLNELPASPANLTATTISFYQINLSWEDKASDETGYKIERKSAGGSFTQIATLNTNSTSYIDNSLNENTSYTYRVYPYNNSGNGGYSNEATNTTQPDFYTGLVTYFPFNGNANDSSGNGINGIVTGATLSSDRFGNTSNSYLFNRSSVNEINLPASNKLDSLSNITISLWVKLKSYGAVNESGYNHYINKSDQTNDHQFIFANNSTQLYFYYGGGANGFTTNHLPPLNKWSHLAVTYNYATSPFESKCRFYIDGQQIDSMTTSAPLKYTKYAVKIGALSTNYFNRVDGNIDDIRIYKRSLSSIQINYLATH